MLPRSRVEMQKTNSFLFRLPCFPSLQSKAATCNTFFTSVQRIFHLHPSEEIIFFEENQQTSMNRSQMREDTVSRRSCSTGHLDQMNSMKKKSEKDAKLVCGSSSATPSPRPAEACNPHVFPAEAERENEFSTEDTERGSNPLFVSFPKVPSATAAPQSDEPFVFADAAPPANALASNVATPPPFSFVAARNTLQLPYGPSIASTLLDPYNIETIRPNSEVFVGVCSPVARFSVFKIAPEQLFSTLHPITCSLKGEVKLEPTLCQGKFSTKLACIRVCVVSIICGFQ